MGGCNMFAVELVRMYADVQDVFEHRDSLIMMSQCQGSLDGD